MIYTRDEIDNVVAVALKRDSVQAAHVSKLDSMMREINNVKSRLDSLERDKLRDISKGQTKVQQKGQLPSDRR